MENEASQKRDEYFSFLARIMLVSASKHWTLTSIFQTDAYFQH